MRRFLDIAAWLLAPVISVPLAVAGYTKLWPCFIAARSTLRFSGLFGVLVFLLYLLLTIRSTRSIALCLRSSLFLAVGCALGAAFLEPNLTGAYDSSKQKRSTASMRSVADFLAGVSHQVPLSPLDQLPEWKLVVMSKSGDVSRDGWGNPILIAIQGNDRFVVCTGACGHLEIASVSSYLPATTQDYEANIVIKNGEFLRYPAGVQY